MRTLNIKSVLPYAGLPAIVAALLLAHTGRADAYLLLRFELLAVFGYLAAVSDVKTRQISNGLVMMMLATWAIIMTPKLFLDTDSALNMLGDSVLGLAAAGGLFLIVYLISRKGLGGGDVKFMAVSGLYLGFNGSLSAIFCGTVLAALTGLALILNKKITRKDTIPLAPFLYAGMLITLFLP